MKETPIDNKIVTLEHSGSGLRTKEQQTRMEKLREPTLSQKDKVEIKKTEKNNKESDVEKIELLSSEIKESSVFGEFGVTIKELEKIKGFETLSQGQRLLVAENLKQLILGRVHEEANINYKKDTADAKFLGKIWQNISKKYQIEKLEKTAVKDMVFGDIKTNKEIITQLIKRTNDGPDVEVSKNGSLEILYVSDKNDLNSEQKKNLEDFNHIATKFSKIPQEWRYGTASKKEQKKYQELRKEYEEEKENILEIKRSEVGNQNAALYMNNIDSQVYGEQFINTSTDVKSQLQNIADKKIWIDAMANIATEKGIYSAAGFLTRSVTTSLIGLAGLPIAAALLGGFRARNRAHSSLKEHEMESRSGVKDESKETKNFIDANVLKLKIEKTIEDINIEENSERRKKLLISLNARIGYTQGKIEDGLVNYGNGASKLSSQYELTSALSFAISEKEVFDMEETELDKRLESFLEFKKEKISDTQKKYIRNQIIKGATVAAGFSVAGYAFRYLGEEWFGWGKKATDEVLNTKQVVSPTTPVNVHHDTMSDGISSAVALENAPQSSGGQSQADMLMDQTRGMGGTQADMLDAQALDANNVHSPVQAHHGLPSSHVGDSVDKKATFLSQEKLPGGVIDHSIIEKGGNIWDSAKSLVKDPHEFGEAWKNSMVHIPGKEGLVHISDVNLVHSGTVVEYVSGQAGTPGHFEVIAPHGYALPDFNAQTTFTESMHNAGHEYGMKTFSTEILSKADSIMQNKIDDIYKYNFLFFKGTQIGEWNGDPSNGIVGIKDMKVEDILNNHFGKPFGGGMDAAEQHNREQLLKFLNGLNKEVKPINGETTGEYVKRAIAHQISSNKVGPKITDFNNPSKINIGNHLVDNLPKKSITVDNLDVKKHIVDGARESNVGIFASSGKYSGTEVLSKNYIYNLNGSLTARHSIIENVKVVSRELSLKLAEYNHLKTEGLGVKAGTLLESIHKEVILYDREFGKGVIDHSKIPGLK